MKPDPYPPRLLSTPIDAIVYGIGVTFLVKVLVALLLALADSI